MKIFNAVSDLPSYAKGAVVAIGNFDGVHLGHQALLAEARDLAKAQGRAFGVLTFEPHPRALFQPDAPPYRISTPELKASRLQAFGVEFLYALEFNWDFASQSAADFIRTILIDGLGAAHVVIGYDFKFGQMRKGTPSDIQVAGVAVTVIDAVADKDKAAFSSSRIRQLLRQGQIQEANHLLGWEWELRGTVVKGDQRGRELGYPTANFPLDDRMESALVHPAYGVYAGRVQIEGEDVWRNAAINIGIRPMFETPQARVESFILDFSGDIYGKILKVRPVQFLRSEAKFNSLEDLIAQMDRDCAQARGILS